MFPWFKIALALLNVVQEPLKLMKADIDAAFRRIPIKPEHWPFAFVFFHTMHGIMVAGHYAMPFGAVASVHAWDRIGMCGVRARCVFCVC